ncbi:tetratricopeptide repeat protein [Flavobacterium sp.]|uniref:tetratricopeptide repeat protein n=1 Tax=Flavobacterium sp. TaxID=239 RepID=UPI0040486355
MKKLILSATLLLSVATFAQKDELKTLKKIYSKNTISEKDLQEYKSASDALETLATEEGDKVYAKFYKVMYPTVVLASKGSKATMQDQMSLYKPDFIKSYGEVINETIEFEKKTGKKIYTDELIEEKAEFKKGISALAMNLNSSSKFKEASALFYSLYTFDPKNEGKSLKNACILAVQAKDYLLAQKLYEEYTNSDYLNSGTTYYAINKVNGTEEEFDSKDQRIKFISLGSHEKPRDVKNATQKADAIKMLAILYAYNKEVEKAKVAYSEARKLAPNDEELKTGEFQLYYNSGFALLADEEKLISEINSSRDNPKKFEELMQKRKDMFLKAIPEFEKAYSINPTDVNTKNILKSAYEITGQTEKANTIK